VKAFFRCPHRRTQRRIIFASRARTHSPPHPLDPRRRRYLHRSLRRAYRTARVHPQKSFRISSSSPATNTAAAASPSAGKPAKHDWDQAIGRAISALRPGENSGCWIVQEAHPHPPRNLPLHHPNNTVEFATCSSTSPLTFSRQTLRLPHPPQRHRPRQRNLRRRPSPAFRVQPRQVNS